jgi:hypothetical protein
MEPTRPASEKQITTNGSLRKLPPPYDPLSLPPIVARTPAAPPLERKALPATNTLPSSAESTKSSKPPVPQKPVELTTSVQRRLSLEVQSQQHPNQSTASFRDLSSGRDIYPPPLPRRAATMAVNSTTLPDRNSPRRKPLPPPGLPPRPSSTDLLDNEGESSELLSWEPLKPS